MTGIICLSLQTMQPSPVPSTCVLCLGNFDGVHIAHRELMHTAAKLRKNRFPDAVCGVFCFDPPTSDFLQDTPAHLCTREEKLERFRETGMEYAFLADFPTLRNYSPEQFVEEILKKECRCVAAVCGFNHRFGHRGLGNAALLQSLLGGPVEVQNEILENEETVSSSRIRQLLWEGDAEAAAQLLSQPYTLRAKVIHGKALGRKWGFPTINQVFPKNALIPKHGVYVTDCTLPDGSTCRGVSNVGNRPTVDHDDAVNCETHLINFDGSLYEEEVTVSFLHYLRSEKKFKSTEELRRQIDTDKQAASEY